MKTIPLEPGPANLGRKYAVGDRVEIELDGVWYMAVITEIAPAKMIAKLDDARAGDANGMYLKLEKGN
jgi:hypothetical protein